MNESILHLKYEYAARSESCFACYFHCYVTCACEMLPLTFITGVFKSIKKNSATIKHIYNESVNIIVVCYVPFDINGYLNFR